MYLVIVYTAIYIPPPIRKTFSCSNFLHNSRLYAPTRRKHQLRFRLQNKLLVNRRHVYLVEELREGIAPWLQLRRGVNRSANVLQHLHDAVCVHRNLGDVVPVPVPRRLVRFTFGREVKYVKGGPHSGNPYPEQALPCSFSAYRYVITYYYTAALERP